MGTLSEENINYGVAGNLPKEMIDALSQNEKYNRYDMIPVWEILKRISGALQKLRNRYNKGMCRSSLGLGVG